MTLTAERLRHLLDYDAAAGGFTRRIGVKGYAAGSRVGYRRQDGRLCIRVDRKLYLASRLAWLHVHGCWPIVELDHRDCDPGNDCFKNFREASRSQNEGNKRKYRNNKSGFKGVCWNKQRQKWIAQICVDNVRKILGFFDDPHEAHSAYVDAALFLRGEFARAA